MKKLVVGLGCYLFALCVQAVITFDNFNDGVINPGWSTFQNGCSISETSGELQIQGTTAVSGWGNGSGVTGYYGALGTSEDFEVSVDFSIPQFSGSGTRLIYLNGWAADGGTFGLFYSVDNFYRVQTWEPSQFSTWLDPFGDEHNSYHQMKLVYDGDTDDLSGYVDDIYVGSLNIQLSGNVYFTLQAASETAGMGIDARFDNFEAIPEPASIGLLGLVSVGLYFTRRFFPAV